MFSSDLVFGQSLIFFLVGESRGYYVKKLYIFFKDKKMTLPKTPQDSPQVPLHIDIIKERVVTQNSPRLTPSLHELQILYNIHTHKFNIF